jgi:hypothetical protein
MTLLEGIKKFWWAIVAAVIVLVVLICLVVANGVTNQGNKKQQDLIVFYNDTSNVLSDCLVKTKSAVGLANAQTDALDKVITDAVKGRYTDGSSAQVGRGQLFSALSEAYPDTSALSATFDKVLIVITGCRSNFKDSQSALQRELARFNKWRSGSFTVRKFGGSNYPNDELKIKAGGTFVKGELALDQMGEMVLVADAETARDTGVLQNDNPFATQ